MPESIPYRWDHDRFANGGGAVTTFSVGVFQWLPKAGGKGLKKSKKIRVQGWVADPDACYRKAAELCKQFNEAGLRVDNLPAWVQKQYSVPKPPGVTVGRFYEGLTSSQVRSIRVQEMKKLLLPRGFVVARESCYVRRRGQLIDGMDFQGSRWGGQFTINLLVQPAILPPHFTAAPMALKDMRNLDFTFTERIGRYIDDGRDKWFEYGHDPDAIRKTIRGSAELALGVLDRFEPGLEVVKLLNKLKRHGFSGRDDTIVACYQAMTAGTLDEATARLETWRTRRPSKVEAYDLLKAQVARLRKDPAAPPIDWFS